MKTLINQSRFSKLAPISIAIATFMAMVLTIPASAHPGAVRWSTVDTPSNAGNTIVSPSEINAIAIGSDSRTFYAVDTSQGKVYKSTDGGITWDDLTQYLATAGAALPAWSITTAPDNPRFVAVVTSDGGLPRKVFLSVDGGVTWQDTKCPAANNISTIAISPRYSGYDIAIGTRTGTGAGKLYIFKAAGQGSWADQNFAGDILAVKFSPGYRFDSCLVTVWADATGTYVNLGIRDINSNTTNWNTQEALEITVTGSGTSPKASQIVTADLELPSDFSGQAPSRRRLYVSIDDAGATGNAGIYRFDDVIPYLLMPASAPKRISSIAYHGTYASGKLLAGEVLGDHSSATVLTWFTDAPITCPEPCWFQTQKAPTGAANSGYANAQVAWSPDGGQAYCATSSATLNDAASWPGGYLISVALDESALSLSLDNGMTWNQVSLIDTEITFLSDVAVTPASDIIYLASINNHPGISNFDSIWRSVGSPTALAARTWERVLCILSLTNDLILRTSGEVSDRSVFFASRLTDDLRQSSDMGQTWSHTLPGIKVTDFSVAIINNVPYIFVLDDNYVRRGKGSAHRWQWAQAVHTALSTGHSITATPTGAVVVGDNGEGMVSYSLDRGISFEPTPAIPYPGRMHVAADYRFRNVLIIYAASDDAACQIYSWVPGSNLGWTAMGSPGRSFHGLAQFGVLYGAWAHGGGAAVDRTLQPERLSPPFVEWDSLSVGLPPGVVFTREPVSLKISAGINLWAIDDRPYTATTGRLWNFYDCLAPSPLYITPAPPSPQVLFQAPVPIAPAMNEVIPIYLKTGHIADIIFRWKHPTIAVEYQLWLAKDSSFTDIILQETISPKNPKIPSWTLPQTVDIQQGERYYWKIRVSQAATGETGEGEWSEVMSFSIASAEIGQDSHFEPVPATSENGITTEDAAFSTMSRLPVWIWIVSAILLITASSAVLVVHRRRKNPQ